ncbi:M20/M25/M40 family metallo-hydrolase [Herbaspirillum sp. HC18]|nr:M20/M25/M40 family metallo-hydrolase [Herbaspirillum sp. HC18]
MRTYKKRFLGQFYAALALCWTSIAFAGPDMSVWLQVQQQKEPLLGTLRELVSIESGSKDREGLDRISQFIFDRLAALGGRVEFIEPGPDTYRMMDTPERPGRMVRATFKGTGSRKILLIAHMDTVYLKGILARQPFHIEDNRAYGLGIGDDKAGVAVILHTIATLKAIGFREYGTLTVLINGDEEISSPASRNLLTKLGGEHDLVMSHEGSPVSKDQLSLATAGIAAVKLKVIGKASHAGAAPEKGRNAVVELAHQVLQTSDFSDPARGVKMNWTVISGGTNRNVIPADAEAAADVRVVHVADTDALEARLRETIKKTLIPDTRVDLIFERRRPPLELRPAAVQAGKLAQKIYEDLGKTLAVDESVQGGGTDAAFAGMNNQNAVLERFGLLSYGAHSNDDEYVLIDSIEPRLYLATKLIMEFSRAPR